MVLIITTCSLASMQDPLCQNRQCWVLHFEHPGVVVAQGKSGRSWRTRNKTNNGVQECDEGEQLVQVTRVFLSGVPIMNVNDMNDITVLDDALSTPTAFLKWSNAHLVEIVKEE